MMAKMSDGTTRLIRPGEALCGVGIKEVTLSIEDLRNERDMKWFQETIWPRLMAGEFR